VSGIKEEAGRRVIDETVRAVIEHDRRTGVRSDPARVEREIKQNQHRIEQDRDRRRK
jgi:hypothetical protein